MVYGNTPKYRPLKCNLSNVPPTLCENKQILSTTA